MKTNRRLFPPEGGENIMKKILLFGCGGIVIFCAILTSPPWLLRLLLSVTALLALMHELSRRAPIGYEDEGGFHYAQTRGRRRSARKGALASSLFSPARSPLKA
jgi:hypothetical protein